MVKHTLNILPFLNIMHERVKTFTTNAFHCVKIVGIRSFSGPYFPAFGLNRDQKNCEYGKFHAVSMI